MGYLIGQKYWEYLIKLRRKCLLFLISERFYLILGGMIILLLAYDLYDCSRGLYLAWWQGSKETSFHDLLVEQSCVALYGAMLLSRVNFYDFYEMIETNEEREYERVVAEVGTEILAIPILFNILSIVIKKWMVNSNSIAINIHNVSCILYMICVILIISHLSWFMVKSKFLKNNKRR